MLQFTQIELALANSHLQHISSVPALHNLVNTSTEVRYFSHPTLHVHVLTSTSMDYNMEDDDRLSIMPEDKETK